MRKRPIKRLIVLALLACAAQAHASSAWEKLWRNADQRGEALLQQGDAKAAAGEFADPRRKSYAEFKAGDYAAAARDLAAFDDSDAHYNRGNALAHAGDLPGALKAYDAALKRDPHNEDARHNRDLVEKALKQQQQQQKNSAQNDSQDNKQDGKQDSKQDRQGQSNSGAQNSTQENRKDDRTGAAQGKPGTQSPQAGKQAAGQEQSRGARQDAQKKPADNRDDAEQARRDAQESIKDSAQNQPGRPGAGDAADGHDAQAPSAPLTEQQISQDQWLRSIPDDPGGLLRRKFLIEHMMRQQGAKP